MSIVCKETSVYIQATWTKNKAVAASTHHGCLSFTVELVPFTGSRVHDLQGGSNMTRTDLCVNKPHCATAVRT